MPLELPGALRPWAELLQLFPHDIALALGALVRRLAVAIGPMQLDPLLGQDEPDGYAGLQNRGDYQRLLLSEWLLAEVEPDEFMRRAVMSEQLFYQPLRLDNKASRASIVLFDSGPDQLGTPRIAHLALLILLARRAQTAGAEFYWGILQQPEAELIPTVTVDQIKHLMHSRTTSLVNAEHLERWRENVQRLSGLGIAELWLLSSVELAKQKLSMADRRILVEDVLSPAQRLLNIRVWQHHRWLRMSLQLPDEKICARLLRNPLQSQKAIPLKNTQPIARSAGLLFSMDGRKLAVQLDEGGVVVYPVPNSAREKIGHPRYFVPRNNEFLIALQLVKKRIQALTSDGHSLFCYRFPGVERAVLPFHESLMIQSEQRSDCLAPCFFSTMAGYRHSLFFLDHGGVLWQVPWPLESAECIQLADLVLQMACLDNWVHFIAQQEGQCFLVLRANSLQPQWLPLDIDDAAMGFMEFHFGHAGSWLQHDIGLLAYRSAVHHWTLIYGETTSILEVHEGITVVGTVLLSERFFTDVMHSSPATLLPCLVLLDKHQGKLRIYQQNYNIEIPYAHDVEEALVEPRYQQIAFVSRDREVAVYNTERKEITLRARSDAAGVAG